MVCRKRPTTNSASLYFQNHLCGHASQCPFLHSSGDSVNSRSSNRFPSWQVFIVMLYPIAKPISMLLNWSLGTDMGPGFVRALKNHPSSSSSPSFISTSLQFPGLYAPQYLNIWKKLNEHLILAKLTMQLPSVVFHTRDAKRRLLPSDPLSGRIHSNVV